MISFSLVRNRESCLNREDYLLSESNLDTLRKACNNTKSISVIETYLKGCSDSGNILLQDIVEVLESFMENSTNNSDKRKAILIFKDCIIPYTKNMKQTRNIVKEFNIPEDLKQQLIQECNDYVAADRIIKNNKKLALKKIPDIFSEELAATTDGMEYMIETFCDEVNKIKMNTTIKYNVCLENILYNFEKKGITYNRKAVLETINDYFLCTANNQDIKKLNNVLESSYFYTDDEKSMRIIESGDVVPDTKEEDDEDDIILDADSLVEAAKPKTDEDFMVELKKNNKNPKKCKEILKRLYNKSPENIILETPHILGFIRKILLFALASIALIGPYLAVVAVLADSVVEKKMQKEDVKRIIKHFRKEKEKSEKILDKTKDDKKKEALQKYIEQLDEDISKLETYEDSLYTDKENDKRLQDKYANEAVELYDYITSKEYMEKYHKQFTLQVYNAVSVLDKISAAKYTKLRALQCILLSSIEDIKKFENCNSDSIYNYVGDDGKISVQIGTVLGTRIDQLESNLELKKCITAFLCDTIQDDVDIDDVVYYDGDDDMYKIYIMLDIPILDDKDISQEAVNVNLVNNCAMIQALSEQVEKASKYNITGIEHLLENASNSKLFNYISDLAILSSGGLNKNALKAKYESTLSEVRKQDSKDKYLTISNIHKAADELNKYSSITKLESKGIYEAYDNIYVMNELYANISDVIIGNPINEMSFINTMKIVQEKLKKNMSKLSDKDKEMSRRLDYAVDSFAQKLRTNLTNKNREAVIKGSILPSASNALKIALAGTVTAVAVNPVLAIIGVLGTLAASKAATVNEKQYILDEIDVQLQVVDKKVQLAERNDDMKSLEELLKIQQKLKREKNRIEYNKKNYVPMRKDD